MKLVALLETVPEYQPNEEDLKIDTLKAYYANLRAKNDTVIDTGSALKSALIERNKLLYTDNSGIVDLTVDVKTYVKSVFGASAPQYKHVSSLEFRKYKN